MPFVRLIGQMRHGCVVRASESTIALPSQFNYVYATSCFTV